MIRLRALGTVDLRGDDGGEIRSVLMQPKRLALFAYLALARPRGFHRRDTLISVFWLDQPPERARPALNQAVYALRRSLGADALVGRGADELAVASERVECDLWELEAALAAGDPARAVELYRGELLTGLVVPDAGELERWLDNERKHWSGRVLQALRDLTDRGEAGGDLAGAVGWARRTLDHAPYDEPALVRLMQLLARGGDRVAAIHACERFSDRLWNDVELRLSPSTREVLSRIKREAGLAEPAGPSRAGAGVVVAAPAATGPAVSAESGIPGPATHAAASTAMVDTAVPVEPVAQPASPGPRKRHLRTAAIIALSLAALGGVGAGVKRLLRPRHSTVPASVTSPRPTRVAVMYLDVNGSDPEQRLRALADGLTEALIDRLTPLQANGLSVISRNGVRYFRGRSVSLDSIRKVLGTPTPLLISGSISGSGNQVRVMVQLEDTSRPTGRTLGSDVVQSRANEPFALIDTLSESVGNFLRQALGREIRLTQAHAGTTDVEAWELFRRGQAVYYQAYAEADSGSSEAARAHFQEADSLFVLAGNEDPAWTEPILARARLARPFAFDAFAAGGGPAAAVQRLQPPQAALERALRHRPDDARVLEQLGLLRYYVTLLAPAPGAIRDTMVAAVERDLRRAVALDPDRADAWSMLSAIDLSAGKLAAAKSDAQSAYAADPYLLSAAEVLNRLFSTSFELHQDADARHACNETERRFNQTWYQAYCALSLMAWTDRRVDPQRAWETYDAPSRVDSPATRARTRPSLAMLMAAALARAGMPDSARHVIARARREAPDDPEVMRLEAAGRLLLGDTAVAHQLMADYLRPNPKDRGPALHSRIFQPLSFAQGQ
jgi:serine/threonine-protein kinase